MSPVATISSMTQFFEYKNCYSEPLPCLTWEYLIGAATSVAIYLRDLHSTWLTLSVLIKFSKSHCIYYKLFCFSPRSSGALPPLCQTNEQTHISEGEKDEASLEEEEKR